MTHIGYKKNTLQIEGIPLTQIAKKYGTPVYCYSASQITDNFYAYHDAFRRITDEKNFTICYAVKANSNLAILRLLKNCGAGADIVSGGELYRARRAGIPPSKIVYSGVGKTEEELTTALKMGLKQINVESERELLLISKISKKLGKTTAIALRVNPDIDAKTHKKITTGKKENKFGIDINDAPALYDRAKKLPNIRASGVALHIGSQLTSLTPYKQAYTRVAKLVSALRARGHDITTIDIGGGIGIRYKDETPLDLDDYAQMVAKIILPLNVHIIMEPGRSITGNAGVLLSRVINIKKGHKKNFMIIDAAMNDLIRPTLYDAWHAVLPCQKTTAARALYDVVGPVCETGDTFLTDERLPKCSEGDLVSIMDCGAYGAAMSSTYNTRPLVQEILIKDKRIAVIRKAQTVKQLVDQDTIPGWCG